MITPNLLRDNGAKAPYSIRLYEDTLDKYKKLSEKSGMRTQDIIKTALNNFLAQEDIKTMLRE